MKGAVAVSISLWAFSACLLGETVSLEGGRVTFDAPDEFKPLSAEVISVKFPAARAPKHVIGNASAATTIAYDIKPGNIGHKLDETRASFATFFPRMVPGLEWKASKTIELSGRKWGYLEMTSSALDTDIYNIMLFTGYQGQMLIFNFNSTREEFEIYEQVLRKSIETISVRE